MPRRSRSKLTMSKGRWADGRIRKRSSIRLPTWRGSTLDETIKSTPLPTEQLLDSKEVSGAKEPKSSESSLTEAESGQGTNQSEQPEDIHAPLVATDNSGQSIEPPEKKPKSRVSTFRSHPSAKNMYIPSRECWCESTSSPLWTSSRPSGKNIHLPMHEPELKQSTMKAEAPRKLHVPLIANVKLEPSAKVSVAVQTDPPILSVPAPKKLTVENRPNESVLISWAQPNKTLWNNIRCYHVYVDGVLRKVVKSTEDPSAVVDGVESRMSHRISIRSVSTNRRTSRIAACTMIHGPVTHYLGPSAVRASDVTAISAVISWLPANSNHQHVLSVNQLDVKTVEPGVYRHTITGFFPDTQYTIGVRAKPHKMKSSLFEELPAIGTACVEFKTLPKENTGSPTGGTVKMGIRKPFCCWENTPEEYSCKECNFKTTLFVFLKQHLQDVHSVKFGPEQWVVEYQLENYSCTSCEFQTTSYLQWLRHFRNHERNLLEEEDPEAKVVVPQIWPHEYIQWDKFEVEFFKTRQR